MKTTFDLPETLVEELQRRAQGAGQDLTQAAAELLWMGLASSAAVAESLPRATVNHHSTAGLPYIECCHAALPATELTPTRVAEVLLEQEATWQNEACR